MLFLREKTCDTQYAYRLVFPKLFFPAHLLIIRERTKTFKSLKGRMHLTFGAATPNLSLLLSNGVSASKLDSCTFLCAPELAGGLNQLSSMQCHINIASTKC